MGTYHVLWRMTVQFWDCIMRSRRRIKCGSGIQRKLIYKCGVYWTIRSLTVRAKNRGNKNFMEDTMKVVEDKWLVFVSQYLEIIYEVLDYTLSVWFEGGEKEKQLMRGDSTTNINTCEQLEERRTQFDHH
jgi:hypothetical protein